MKDGIIIIILLKVMNSLLLLIAIKQTVRQANLQSASKVEIKYSAATALHVFLRSLRSQKHDSK